MKKRSASKAERMKTGRMIVFITMVATLVALNPGKGQKMNQNNDQLKFDKTNIFGKGEANEMFAKFFTGQTFLNPLTKPGESPVFLANVTFEPGCRTHWHVHQAKSGGGQMLICTAGEGWYQEEGKKPQHLSAGSFINIPAGVKHWHGAKADCWFSHIAAEIPGVETGSDIQETVADEYYNSLPLSKGENTDRVDRTGKKLMSKREFKTVNMFGFGMRNVMFGRYFSGRSYLKMITLPGKAPLFLTHVTFEPGCRNNWHIHHAGQGGGQILICTAGEGWFQEEGKNPVSLHEGSVVVIPAEVKHWHGAKADSWFSHIAMELPGDESKVEWLEPVPEKEYTRL